MRIHPMIGLLGLLLLCEAPANAATTSRPLPRSSPEKQGVSSRALLDFVDAADREVDAMNSLMVVRHGAVIAEGWWAPYHAESRHMLYSLSKSFTSTAVGLAVNEGRFSLDDAVLEVFPEDAPEDPSANLKAMRVRDLLSMSTGHQDATSSAPDQISARAFLAHPVPHKPGTHFRYNTPATFMLSAIVQKRTGQTVLDYLKPRLFEPLGVMDPVWQTNWQGISLGGYGLRIRTEDIAKFGQLYLQQGMWDGKEVLPAAWVEAATARQTSTGSNPSSDWDQGYGYQFWRCRHGAYRGDGAFGQYCLVLPDQDAVVAITSGVKNMQMVLDLIWERLLPAFQETRLPPDPDGENLLRQRLNRLSLPSVEGADPSPLARRLMGRSYRFEDNEAGLDSISLEPTDDGKGLVLVLRSGDRVSRFPCGHRSWKEGRGDFGNLPDEPVAGSAALTEDGICLVKLCAFETPYYMTLKLQFNDGELRCMGETNVGFGETKLPALFGRSD